MENRSKEDWEVEDYSTSYESNDKSWWTCREGLSLGKKLVVAGVVITSTPLLLPPLVALSTIGIALSVPAGFAYVTYACTEKVVNSLLPPPPSLPSLEKGAMSSNDEADWIYGDDAKKWYGEDQDVEAEGEDFGKDKRKEIGMRDELGDGNDQAYNYGPVSTNKNELDTGTSKNEIAEENVYEEDAMEYTEHDEQTLSSDAIPDILQGIREAEDEISSRKKESDELPVDSLQAVIVAANVGGENENEVVEEIAYLAPSHLKEETMHKRDFADIDEKKEMRKGTTGLTEEFRSEGDYDLKGKDKEAQRTPKENKGTEELPVCDLRDDKGNRNLFVIPEEVKPAQDGKEVTNGSKSEAKSSSVGDAGTRKKASKKRSKKDKSGLIQEESKLAAEKRLEVHVKTHGDQTMTDVRQGTNSDSKKGTSNLSNSDVDHGTMVPERILNFAVRTPEGEELTSKNGGVNVGHHQASVESRKPMAKQSKSKSNQGATSSSYKVKGAAR